ncbi:hypothetical protein N9H74_06175 [Hyphomicrobiales bacterium]|nr:hypothetical protein [Hyphomicrobiales bacterium]
MKKVLCGLVIVLMMTGSGYAKIENLKEYCILLEDQIDGNLNEMFKRMERNVELRDSWADDDYSDKAYNKISKELDSNQDIIFKIQKDMIFYTAPYGDVCKG